MSEIDIQKQAEAWTDIRETFKVNQTANGPGSTVEFTQPLREWMPEMLRRNDIYSIIDAPCGDLNWLGLVDLSEQEYTGFDVEPSIIKLNRLRYPHFVFHQANLLDLDEGLPSADLFICRDFLFHLPNEAALRVVDAIRASGSRLLLTTTHAGAPNDLCNAADLGEGVDDRPGYWYRPIDVEAAPFNLGPRIDAVREDEGREMVLVEL